MRSKKLLGYGMLFILLALVLSTFSIGAPEGGNATIIESSRHQLNPAENFSALAGDVTMLSLHVNTSTMTWAGYYGNVTGTLVLENSNNFSIYEWNVTDPRGEIYMVNDTLDFSSIECWNESRTDDATYFTLTEFEEYLGVEPNAEDGVNETFSKLGEGTHDEFYVGTTFIAADSCPATNLFNESGEKEPGRFEEVLLYDKANELVVYTSILEQSYVGFDGNEFDFQMIVGENGHDNTDITSYYLYLEIE